jgi:Nuclease-related domain
MQRPEPRPASEWRVKHDGVCARCGISLHTGQVAIYERPTRSIRCVVCPTEAEREAGPEGEPMEPAIDVGVAGASASREHERRKANREARAKDKYGVRLGGLVLALTNEPQSTRAWATGARGEEKFARALEGMAGIVVLHDRRVPGTRGNIDHLVVAPAGVFVVDAKRYQGKIEIRNKGWLLRPDLRLCVGRRDCSALATGLTWQVAAVETALRAAGVDPLPPLTPVLCFIDGDWPLISPPNSYAGVRLEGTRSIRKSLVATAVLDAAEIDRLARILSVALPAK